MKLKDNRGYTGIDISVTIIIILIFIPTIFGILYNLQKIKLRSEREAIAINLATEVLETAKGLEYSNVYISDSESETSQFQVELEKKYSLSNPNNNYDIIEEGYKYNYYTYTDSGSGKDHYRIQVGVKNYYPEEFDETIVSEENDFVKIVKTIVTYPVGNNTKKIEISTVKQNNH